MSEFRIAGYITAYQDFNSLNKCLLALKQQTIRIETIYIVDNSYNSLRSYISADLDNFLIIEHCPENIGVAGGLFKAISWALNEGYDFLWAFDQDSQPNPDTLKTLLSEYEYLKMNHVNVGIVSPTIIDVQTQRILSKISSPFRYYPHKPKYYRDELYQCDVVITSGSLINLKAARCTPLPNQNLFIDGVDWDYCLKMKAHGHHVCVTERATMYHTFGTYLTQLNSDYLIYGYSPLRYYYINRNHTYIETRLCQNFIYRVLAGTHRLKILVKKIVKIIIFEPDRKLLKIAASILGFYHGIIGRLGKLWV